MRIIDWSSDVCSSDLGQTGVFGRAGAGGGPGQQVRIIRHRIVLAKTRKTDDLGVVRPWGDGGDMRVAGGAGGDALQPAGGDDGVGVDRKSTRLNSSH